MYVYNEDKDWDSLEWNWQPHYLYHKIKRLFL